jgi:DNA-directed RNA polymerase specialized sigma24 family protein
VGTAPPVDFAAFSAAVHTRLVQQTYLVTGSVRRAGRSVHRALGAAAMRWEEVATLSDPEGWVRAAAFESALSPWHRGGAGRRRATRAERAGRAGPVGSAAADRALLAALLRLSRVRRRAVVLHDAVGLPVPELALEVEASTAAAEGRVLAAREELARAVPALVGDDPLAPGFGTGLGGLLHDAAVRGCPAPPRPSAAGLASAARLRAGAANAAAALLTVAVGGAMVATFAGGDPGGQARPPAQVVVAPPPEVCSAAGTGSSGPAAPGRTPGLHSPWCSPVAPPAEALPPAGTAPADGTDATASPSDGSGAPSAEGLPAPRNTVSQPAATPRDSTVGDAAPLDAVPPAVTAPHASDGAEVGGGSGAGVGAAAGPVGPVPLVVPCAPVWPCPTLSPSALPYPLR